MTFGERLRKLREQNHWTQQQLSEKTGISPRVLGYYENDQRLSSAITAITKLSKVLRTTPDYLILGASPCSAPEKNYSIENSGGLWVSDAQSIFNAQAYTEEELQVLDHAREAGVNAYQLKKAVDLLKSLLSL